MRPLEEEEILARKKLLEEVGTDRPEKEIPHPAIAHPRRSATGAIRWVMGGGWVVMGGGGGGSGWG